MADEVAPVFQSIEVVSDNPLSPLHATLGDTITFTLTLAQPDTAGLSNHINFSDGSRTYASERIFSSIPLSTYVYRRVIEGWEDGVMEITNIAFVDEAGNMLTGAVLPYTPIPHFTMDNIAPTEPIVSYPGEWSFINDNIPTITGTSEPDITITITSWVHQYSTQADWVGNWEIDILDALPEGNNTLSIMTTDFVGQNSALVNLSFNVDTTIDNIAPTQPVVSYPGEWSFINNNIPTITGTSQSDVTVTITSWIHQYSTQADWAGNWEIDILDILPEGSNTLSIIATDVIGLQSSLVNLSFNVDSIAPTDPVVSYPGEWDLINDNIPTITGTSQPTTVINISVWSNSYTGIADEAGNWEIDVLNPLSDGNIILSVWTSDGVGNTSATTNVNFDLDATPPDAPEFSYPTQWEVIDDENPFIEGTLDENEDTNIFITIINAAGEYTEGEIVLEGFWEWESPEDLLEGNNTLFAFVTDAAWNNSPLTQVNFIVLVSPDGDGDGIPDDIEIEQWTDPTNSGSFLDTDNDGISDFSDFNDDGDFLEDYMEDLGPNQWDANNDGTVDSAQWDVASVVSEVSDSYVALETTQSSNNCNVSQFSVIPEASLPVEDANIDYPVWLNQFTLDCGTPWATAAIKIYYDSLHDTTDWVYKKYNSTTDTYTDISSIVNYTIENVWGVDVTVVTYQVTDGWIHDEDGLLNWIIVDPAGPAIDNNPSGEAICGWATWAVYSDYNSRELKRMKKVLKFKNPDKIKKTRYPGMKSIIAQTYGDCANTNEWTENIPTKIISKTSKFILKWNKEKYTKKQIKKSVKSVFWKLEKLRNKTQDPSTINIINYIEAQLATLYIEKQ